MTAPALTSRPLSDTSAAARAMRRLMAGGTVTLLASALLLAYLLPFLYMLSTATKNQAQIAHPKGPWWPAEPAKYEHDGQVYDVYRVPTEDGVREWALVKPGRETSQFIDPDAPEAGLIEWEGRWRTLDPAWEWRPQWQNFVEVWRVPGRSFTFLTWLGNTFGIAALGIVGTLLSCVAVAYGFSRFRFPGRNVLFILLISTIFLPRAVVTVPLYAFFVRIGWVGTWLPLVVPHFFANAYNVFWLRQYFMTIPRELDEAAMIDGAGPVRILLSIIVPQSMPALITVALFHMVFAWRDFFEPLIYLSARPELQPISVGIQQFNALYGAQPQLIQAAALLGLLVPVALFFAAQRYFMQGLVVTGVEK